MSFPALNHELTSASNSAYGVNWKCTSVTNGVYLYTRVSGGGSGDPIAYDGTNWIDGSSSSAPTTFGTSRTDSTIISPTGSSTNLFLYNNGNWYQELVNPNPLTSGGGNFLGGDPVLSGSSTQKKVFCNFW